MIRCIKIYTLCLMLAFFASCTHGLSEAEKIIITPENKGIATPYGPGRITRNIIQDRRGKIWMATFEGVFKYDGKSFTNITAKITSERFFSILEDSKGDLWFGTVGSGVYRYNGKILKKFTTDQGMLDNEAGCIYEDSKGNIWFGNFAGVSCYDGKVFHHYILNGNTMFEDKSGNAIAKKHLYGVNAITQDKNGVIWFGTDGVIRYDGKSFTPFTHNGAPFKNVRSIIRDSKGNIWLGGADGLWRYDGSTITNLTPRFVGHIMEDRKGNTWTSSGWNSYKGWALFRYNAKSLTDKQPRVSTVVSKPMIFGIMEDSKGNIWFGDFDGVHRYDGKAITDFKNKEEVQ